MKRVQERRKEERLQYHLPVLFSEHPDNTSTEGVMVDISSSAMAFSCKADKNRPYSGQHLTTRFSLPNSCRDCSSDMKTFTRTGCVSRVENLSGNLCRVAIRFDSPPPFWNTPPTI